MTGFGMIRGGKIDAAVLGGHKIVDQCALPLTGKGVLQRIITDLCVLGITPTGFRIVELAPDVTEN